MYLILSHVLAFSTLFIASLFDLDTTDVPDEFAVAGVMGGITLHAVYSFMTGDWSYLLWSLGVGTVFSVAGWGAYFAGGWGGADAFAMSVLGFAAPFVPPEPSLVDPVNLVVNVMLAAFVYTTLYTVSRNLNLESVLSTYSRLADNRIRVAGELLIAGMLAAVVQINGMNGYGYFGILTFLIVLYRFFQEVQENLMLEEKPLEEVEVGEVAAPGQGFGKKIVGLTEEDLEETDLDEIKIRTGVPFMPVFVIALIVTDFIGGGMGLIISLL